MLSVLLPTRKRIPRLKRMLESFNATVMTESQELVFRVDDDDRESFEFLQDYPLRRTSKTILSGPRLDGYRSLPAFYNEMARSSRGDLFMCANDDMFFRTPGWVDRILQTVKEYPDGVYNVGVTTYNYDVIPFSVVSRQTFEALGFINDERLLWSDLFLCKVFEELGRKLIVADVQIDHEWVGLTGERPEQKEWENKFVYAREGEYYATQAQCVREAVEKLRPLMRSGRAESCMTSR